MRVNILLVCVLITGCAAASRDKTTSPPAWLKNPPRDEASVLYQLGSCGKTLMRKDAVERGFESGVAELAKRLKVRVKSVMVEIQQGNQGTWTGKDVRLGVSEEVADLVLYGAEPVSDWYDVKGTYGAKGTTYVLVRWSESRFKSRLNELLKEFGGDLEKIRESGQ